MRSTVLITRKFASTLVILSQSACFDRDLFFQSCFDTVVVPVYNFLIKLIN
jgi:hypothetical protein